MENSKNQCLSFSQNGRHEQNFLFGKLMQLCFMYTLLFYSRLLSFPDWMDYFYRCIEEENSAHDIAIQITGGVCSKEKKSQIL